VGGDVGEGGGGGERRVRIRDRRPWELFSLESGEDDEDIVGLFMESKKHDEGLYVRLRALEGVTDVCFGTFGFFFFDAE